jgi:hypothetical protein
MGVIEVWQPDMPSSYRVDFFNPFARGERAYRVYQRSIVVRAVCCAEEAREIAKAYFAEIEEVPDWRVRAAAIEVVAIADDPPAGAQDRVPPNPAGPAATKAKRGGRAGAAGGVRQGCRE